MKMKIENDISNLSDININSNNINDTLMLGCRVQGLVIGGSCGEASNLQAVLPSG